MVIFPFALAAFVAAEATLPDTSRQPGVYFSSTEVLRNTPTRPGRVAAVQPASDHLVVVTPDTYTVHQVPLAHAWGFADARQQVFRLVNRQAYLVTRQDSVVLYSRPRTVQYGRNATTFTEHFFSKGLDGELYPLTRRQLRKQLAAD